MSYTPLVVHAAHAGRIFIETHGVKKLDPIGCHLTVEKSLSDKIADSVLSAFDGVATALFILFIFIIIRLTLYKPFVTPNLLKEHSARIHGLPRGASWSELQTEAENKAAKKAKEIFGVDPKKSLQNLSKTQQDGWKWARLLDRA